MNDEQFKKADEKMMHQMKPVRERRVSPEFLKGFAASVIRKIESLPLERRRTGLRARSIVPVFAVLVLAVVAVFRAGLPVMPVVPAGAPVVFEIARLPEPIEKAAASLAEEIEALKELGVWTEDDEKAAGVTGEDEEIEEMLG